jgi:hypothetical protein
MIWRALFFGFILRKIKNNHIVLNDSISANAVSKRLRSYSEEFDNHNDTSNAFTKNNENTFFKGRPGYDERYNSSNHKSGDDVILNITKFNMQMKLLKTLENKGVSIHNKITLIEHYNKDEKHSPILPNILAGDLYKDWENNWDYDYPDQ